MKHLLNSRIGWMACYVVVMAVACTTFFESPAKANEVDSTRNRCLLLDSRNEHEIADFHAAGRHTHITELVRNGASIVETKELARRSDVRMTMKYAHIGIDDRVKALASLPDPANSELHMRCISRGTDGHLLSAIDTTIRHRMRKTLANAGVCQRFSVTVIG